jgi:hypothetical protein
MAKLPFFPADGLYLRDDFYYSAAVTTGAISELQWDLTAITGAGTPSFVAGDDSHFGVFRDTTDGTTAHGTVYHLLADMITLGPKGGFFRAKVRFPAAAGNLLAGNNFRFGLQDSVTATDSTCGIWVDILEGVVTVQADSATEGDNTLTVGAAGEPIVPTLTTNTTIVLGTWHKFEVRWSGENAAGGPAQVDAYIDDYYAGSIPCLLDNDETMELSFTHWDTSAGDTFEADVDYIELFIAR